MTVNLRRHDPSCDGNCGSPCPVCDNLNCESCKPNCELAAHYADELARLDRECGVSITLGPAHDPSGTTCEEDRDAHPRDGRGRLLHCGTSPFGDGTIEWTGGGACAGDALPFEVIR